MSQEKNTTTPIPSLLMTDRLIVRRPSLDDCAAVEQAKKSTREILQPWFVWAQKDEDFTLDAARDLVDDSISSWDNNTRYGAFVFEKQSGAFIAACGLTIKDKSLDRYELGYWATSGNTGKGYITEAANAMTRFAFDFLHASSVIIRMNPINEKSRGVATRLGYEFEGILRRSYPCPVTGKPRDTALYSRIDTAGLPPLKYTAK